MRRGNAHAFLFTCLATMLCCKLSKCSQHAGHGKQAAVSGYSTNKIANETGNFCLGQYGVNTAILFICRENRGIYKLGKVLAAIQQLLETAKVFLDCCNLVFGNGKFKQCGGIPHCHSGSHRFGIGH